MRCLLILLHEVAAHVLVIANLIVAGAAQKEAVLWQTICSALSGAQVWRLQAPLQADVDRNVRHLADLDPPTVGFHVRGGDKLQEDQNGVRPAPLLCPLCPKRGSLGTIC